MDGLTELSEVLGHAASAHDKLKRCAIEGRLRPGRRLIPEALETHFAISATPIRDALVRLAAEGFVTWDPGRGFFAKAFLVEEQLDLYQFLLIVLPSCWDWSGAGPLIKVVEATTSFQDSFSSPADADAEHWNTAIEHLFAVAADTTQNDMLRAVARNAVERTRLVRMLDFQRLETRRHMAEQIAAFAKATRARDLSQGLAVANREFESLQARLPAIVEQATWRAMHSRFP